MDSSVFKSFLLSPSKSAIFSKFQQTKTPTTNLSRVFLFLSTSADSGVQKKIKIIKKPSPKNEITLFLISGMFTIKLSRNLYYLVSQGIASFDFTQSRNSDQNKLQFFENVNILKKEKNVQINKEKTTDSKSQFF